MVNYDDIRDNLKTGDIVLFSGMGRISDLIKFFSGSKWSHIGLVVKSDDIDMVLLWESTSLNSVNDIESGTAKNGVQLVALSERIAKYDGEISVRHFQSEITQDMRNALKQFRKESKNKPYEKSRLELAFSLIDVGWFTNNEEDFSSMFCSELVAEALEKMGIMNGDLPANEFIPKDFFKGGRFEHYLLPGMEYGDEIQLK